MSLPKDKLLEELRCPNCEARVHFSDALATPAASGSFECTNCKLQFPIINDVPRLVLPSLREALAGKGSESQFDRQQAETALSFGYEWQRFPEMYEEWERTFLNYMQPHGLDFFRGKKVLDAGCGSGRFAFYAAKYGAEVWAIDLGPAVEVARRNTEGVGRVQVIQADLHRPPFAPESFDFIYSLGVLHHLPDPERAFHNLLRYLKPSGEIQIYLYWRPEHQPLKQAMLSCITAARKVTTRLPHQLLYALAYPAAAAAFLFLVWPYRLLKSLPGFRAIADKMPMKQYANFPFRVCVNDQLDRFSAPIEHRYTKQDVSDWLARARLTEAEVSPAYGWVGTGRKTVSETN